MSAATVASTRRAADRESEHDDDQPEQRLLATALRARLLELGGGAPRRLRRVLDLGG
jgi:hypothetical protein